MQSRHTQQWHQATKNNLQNPITAKRLDQQTNANKCRLFISGVKTTKFQCYRFNVPRDLAFQMNTQQPKMLFWENGIFLIHLIKYNLW